MSNKSKNPTVSFTSFESERLTFTDLEENERSKGQKIAYPRYDHPKLGKDQPLFLQFPWITLSTYGVPRIGEYYPDDKSRSFVKVPIDPDDEEVMALVSKLKKLDERLGSDDFKKEAFGKKAKKYSYIPFVREAVQDDDDENQRFVANDPKVPCGNRLCTKLWALEWLKVYQQIDNANRFDAFMQCMYKACKKEAPGMGPFIKIAGA